MQELIDSTPEIKTNLDTLSITASELKAAASMQEQSTALLLMLKHLKGEKTDIDKLKAHLKENKDEVRRLSGLLSGLDSRALQQLEVHTIMTTQSSSRLIEKIKQVDRDFNQLKGRSVLLTVSADLLSKLGQSVVKVIGQAASILGIAASAGGVVKVLDEANKLSLEINKEIMSFSRSSVGGLVDSAVGGNITKHIQSTRRLLKDYTDEWGVAEKVSASILAESGKTGFGAPLKIQEASQINRTILDLNLGLGLNATEGAKLLTIEMHVFGNKLGPARQNIMQLFADSQAMGTSFSAHSQLVRRTNEQFLGYGETLGQTSTGLTKIHGSKILDSVGIRPTKEQATQFYQLQASMKRGVGLSNNTLLFALDKMNLVIGNDMKALIQDTRASLMKPDSKNDMVERVITKELFKVDPTSYLVVKKLLQQFELPISDVLAMAISEGFKAGKIKTHFLSDLVGAPSDQDMGGAGEDPDTRPRLIIDKDSYGLIVSQLKGLYQLYGIDGVEHFKNKFMNAVMSQMDGFKSVIAQLLSGVSDAIKLLTQAGAASKIGAMGFITTLAAGAAGATFAVKAYLTKLRPKMDKSELQALDLLEEGTSKGFKSLGGGRKALFVKLAVGAGLSAGTIAGILAGKASADQENEKESEPTPSLPSINLNAKVKDFDKIKKERMKTNKDWKPDKKKIQANKDAISAKIAKSRESIGGLLPKGQIDKFLNPEGLGEENPEEIVFSEERVMVERLEYEHVRLKGKIKVVEEEIELNKLKLKTETELTTPPIIKTISELETLHSDLVITYKKINDELYRFRKLDLKSRVGVSGEESGFNSVGGIVSGGSLSSKMMNYIHKRNPSKANEIIQALLESSREFNVPVALLAAQMRTEGDFVDHGANSAGASGYTQFIPSTWKQFGEGSPHVPKNAIKAQAKYMRYIYKLIEQTASQQSSQISEQDKWKLAAAGYNAGPDAALKYIKAHGPGPINFDSTKLKSRENREYVPKIEKFLKDMEMSSLPVTLDVESPEQAIKYLGDKEVFK